MYSRANLISMRSLLHRPSICIRTTIHVCMLAQQPRTLNIKILTIINKAPARRWTNAMRYASGEFDERRKTLVQMENEIPQQVGFARPNSFRSVRCSNRHSRKKMQQKTHAHTIYTRKWFKMDWNIGGRCDLFSMPHSQQPTHATEIDAARVNARLSLVYSWFSVLMSGLTKKKLKLRKMQSTIVAMNIFECTKCVRRIIACTRSDTRVQAERRAREWLFREFFLVSAFCLQ